MKRGNQRHAQAPDQTQDVRSFIAPEYAEFVLQEDNFDASPVQLVCQKVVRGRLIVTNDIGDLSGYSCVSEASSITARHHQACGSSLRRLAKVSPVNVAIPQRRGGKFPIIPALRIS